MNQHQYCLLLTLLAIPSCQAFTHSNIQNSVAFINNYNVNVLSSSSKFSKIASSSTSLYMTVVSPFEEGEGSATTTTTTPDGPSSIEGPLDLTWDNVEAVLDTMRSYLIQDGGNVAIKEIDGPIVRLELQGACGTCPSSTQTLKMGLERGLREKIPEIQEVIQAMPEGPPLEMEQVDVVLDGVRPFLQVAGGEINCLSISGEGSLRPCILLKMEGASATLKSVKLEIQQRLQRHFMLAGLVVEWDE